MPQHDTEPPDAEWEPPTAQHRAIARIATERARAMIDPSVRKLVIALVLAVLGTGGGGLATSLATSAAAEARAEERAAALEHRVELNERRLDGIAGLQRDVAALGAKVDAWRQSDSAASSAERAAIADRLRRIEERLDRRR